jgi:hypothetical protein
MAPWQEECLIDMDYCPDCYLIYESVVQYSAMSGRQCEFAYSSFKMVD